MHVRTGVPRFARRRAHALHRGRQQGTPAGRRTACSLRPRADRARQRPRSRLGPHHPSARDWGRGEGHCSLFGTFQNKNLCFEQNSKVPALLFAKYVNVEGDVGVIGARNRDVCLPASVCLPCYLPSAETGDTQPHSLARPAGSGRIALGDNDTPVKNPNSYAGHFAKCLPSIRAMKVKVVAPSPLK